VLSSRGSIEAATNSYSGSGRMNCGAMLVLAGACACRAHTGQAISPETSAPDLENAEASAHGWICAAAINCAASISTAAGAAIARRNGFAPIILLRPLSTFITASQTRLSEVKPAGNQGAASRYTRAGMARCSRLRSITHLR